MVYLKLAKNKSSVKSDNKFQKRIRAFVICNNGYAIRHSNKCFNLSQCIKNSSETDWNKAKGVIRYLKGTKLVKLKLGNDGIGLVVYFDADRTEDRSSRKSYSNYILKYNGRAITRQYDSMGM